MKIIREAITEKASKEFHSRVPELKKKRWKPASFTLQMKSMTIRMFRMLSTMRNKGFSSILKPLKIVITTSNKVVARIIT
jgi:hypothetical protein